MKIFEKFNGLMMVGLVFLIASIVLNIINIASKGEGNIAIATALIPVGLGLYMVGLQQKKKSDSE